MSKHSEADDKLHVREQDMLKKLPKNRLKHQANEPTGPPAGTNAQNQFR